MKITYDSEVDAVYIYLTDKFSEAETRQVDGDINFDFDASNRLIGIEVLGASERLDLKYLGPIVEEIGRHVIGWPKLRQELLRRKQNGEPVKTPKQQVNNWIKDVGLAHAVFLSERSKNGKTTTISRTMLEQRDLGKHELKRRSSLVKALWEIGSYRQID